MLISIQSGNWHAKIILKVNRLAENLMVNSVKLRAFTLYRMWDKKSVRLFEFVFFFSKHSQRKLQKPKIEGNLGLLWAVSPPPACNPSNILGNYRGDLAGGWPLPHRQKKMNKPRGERFMSPDLIIKAFGRHIIVRMISYIVSGVLAGWPASLCPSLTY